MYKYCTLLFLFFLSISTGCYAEEKETILTVTGHGQVKIQATLADINIGVEVVEKTAEAVQKAIAIKQQYILDKIRKHGVDKVEAKGFWLYPQYHKENNHIISYKGKASIFFSTSVEKSGKVLDLAIQSGANTSSNISVKPTEEALENARKKALELASKNAMEEGRLILGALGLSCKKIYKIEIFPKAHSGPIFQMNKSNYQAYESSASTEVSEQEVLIEAKVNIQMEFQGKNF